MLTRNTLQATAIAVTAMALLAPVQPAAAQNRPVFVYGESENTRVEHVKFADLSLATSKGARKLKARVGNAVERVCLFEPEIRLQAGDYHACAGDSWAQAQPQIDRAIAQAEALALSGQPATISAAITIVAQ